MSPPAVAPRRRWPMYSLLFLILLASTAASVAINIAASPPTLAGRGLGIIAPLSFFGTVIITKLLPRPEDGEVDLAFWSAATVTLLGFTVSWWHTFELGVEAGIPRVIAGINPLCLEGVTFATLAGIKRLMTVGAPKQVVAPAPPKAATSKAATSKPATPATSKPATPATGQAPGPSGAEARPTASATVKWTHDRIERALANYAERPDARLRDDGSLQSVKHAAETIEMPRSTLRRYLEARGHGPVLKVVGQ